jgi:allantoin racemase
MRIHVVTPCVSESLGGVEELAAIASPGVEVTHSRIESGPASIETRVDEALALPGTLAAVRAAGDADAIVIDCMGDPGLEPAREVVPGLVLGPAQASMHVAAMLAQSFSVLAVLDATVPMIEELALRYGLASKLRSVRSIGIPVLELEDDRGRMIDALSAAALAAVEHDGAHAIVLGCTGMVGAADAVAARLDAAGLPGIPVLDPLVTAFKLAEALADLGLRPSRRTYPGP